MTDLELMKQSFERITGVSDAWTNPALMQARNGFIQGWEAARLSAPEPVAWEYCGALFHDKEEVFAWHERGDISDTPPKPLYTAPPQHEWQSLTDEEIGDVIKQSEITLKNYCSEDKQTEYARAIEQALREKNT